MVKMTTCETGLWLIAENEREAELLKIYRSKTLRGNPYMVYWREPITSDLALLLRLGEDKYKEGFDLLMEYWDSLPDEAKPELNKKLTELGL